MSKSTIGKLSRRRLNKQFEAGSFAQYRTHSNGLSTNDVLIVARSSQVNGVYNLSSMDKKIVEIVSKHIKTSAEAILPLDVLDRLGIDSIGYMQIKKSLQDAFRFDQDIPMAMLCRCNPPELADHTG